MAEIDFTTLPFDEAVSTAMQEFDMDEQDATEFINLIHGKGSDTMTEKAKKSLPKGTFTKIRKDVAGKANNPDALAGWIKNRMKMGKMKPPMMKKKEITIKAGTSEGVKKGWLSRRRGGGSLGKKIFSAATFGPRAYVAAGKKTAGAAKKFVTSERGKKIIKGAAIGAAVLGGTALAVGAARSSRGRAALSSFRKPKSSSPTRVGIEEYLKPNTIKTPGVANRFGSSLRTRAGEKFRSAAEKHLGVAISKTGTIYGRVRGSTASRAGAALKHGIRKATQPVRVGAKLAARKVKKGKLPYEYGGKLRSGVTYHHALSPRITHYGSKETSLMARVDNIRSDVSKSVGEDYFIADIYDGYAVVSAWKENTYYKVPYMETKDGVTVAAKDQWTEVEKSWEEVESKEISSLTITKDANDKWRWTLFSTNSFEDRDGEVISKKSLENDLDISELEFKDKGNYGPLRWWHVVTGDDPVKDGLDIGTCDFRGLEDRMMIESGTFLNEDLGEAIAPHAKELGGSIGFKHSTSEPDSDKVFHSIRIFERSLLPLERASNPLARLIIQKEGGIMQKEKIDKLTELLGGKDKAEKVLGAAKEAQDKADAEGIRNKETQVVETKDEGQVVDASEELTQEEWEGFVEAVGEALSELLPENDEPEGDVENKEVNELKAALKEQNSVSEKLVDALGKLDTRLKELEGGQPTSKPHVASESKDTITTNKNHSEPAPDPLNSFMDSFVLKK